jgi:hypothetical protein
MRLLLQLQVELIQGQVHFDITGKQVATFNQFNIGYNEVLLDKSLFQASGTYFYRFTTGKYSGVKKMLFIGE